MRACEAEAGSTRSRNALRTLPATLELDAHVLIDELIKIEDHLLLPQPGTTPSAGALATAAALAPFSTFTLAFAGHAASCWVPPHGAKNGHNKGGRVSDTTIDGGAGGLEGGKRVPNLRLSPHLSATLCCFFEPFP